MIQTICIATPQFLKYIPPRSGLLGQNDAREAGLALVFEMDDLSFRLGDRNRYPA